MSPLPTRTVELELEKEILCWLIFYLLFSLFSGCLCHCVCHQKFLKFYYIMGVILGALFYFSFTNPFPKEKVCASPGNQGQP